MEQRGAEGEDGDEGDFKGIKTKKNFSVLLAQRMLRVVVVGGGGMERERKRRAQVQD